MSKRRSGLAYLRRAYCYPTQAETSSDISYISILNTIWLYPQVDLQWTLDNTEISYTQSGSSIYFDNVDDLVAFYVEVYTRTADTQSSGNQGYSLGVGTRTIAYGDQKLYMKLNSGETVVVWTLMTQITNQSDLSPGGNSPDGTVGWGIIYSDWDLNGVKDSVNVTLPNDYLDLLLFQQI
jgi:hypothetical protein